MRNVLDDKLQVILPQNYLVELKDAPNDGRSFSLFFENVCTVQPKNQTAFLDGNFYYYNPCQITSYPHSGGPTVMDLTVSVIKNDLARYMGSCQVSYSVSIASLMSLSAELATRQPPRSYSN